MKELPMGDYGLPPASAKLLTNFIHDRDRVDILDLLQLRLALSDAIEKCAAMASGECDASQDLTQLMDWDATIKNHIANVAGETADDYVVKFANWVVERGVRGWDADEFDGTDRLAYDAYRGLAKTLAGDRVRGFLEQSLSLCERGRMKSAAPCAPPCAR